ncbi:tRNA pseudouridine(55) synthase TruB [Lederbergia citrea]|uniref:tRNA pseudouridine synthase B n=1 Tax=Lederbergia citrea TaxID=2833581 RepID=A0A942UPH0_9BACI|nr:tRNA pseudouridine(55) synthase TruB [Lederbergia citrea]MBS4177078.1 tRNA pseudouridine(55) synthase TruB [Lederbergia citrea]MBS4203741.1 tRNA pseudouridine(55) synthase TruB [Lederbergia citrea]MBS4221674.1 tRNA pseudouridine(55) synthase TruB [Lederbergia citrea]
MDGILPLWKPMGLTSHDCVFKIRKMLRTKKVGHTGTLDPDVEGVLPICLGKATKIAEYITDAGKVYEGEVTLGFSTTTEDASGDVVESNKVDRNISIEEIKTVLQSLTGEIEQTPPMYSAVKVNGKRLYEYARAGILVDRPSRKVNIYDLTLFNESISAKDGLVSFAFRVHCSKGTYIRTLSVMIGEKLGFPAHMSKLTRVASADFTVNDCVTFDTLERIIEEGKLADIIYPLEKGISHLPIYQLDDNLALKVKNGAVLTKPKTWPEGEVVMTYHDMALAIYQAHPEKENVIKPVKVLRNENI